ncbi:hypothetical protein BCR44DRAFT_28384 [Catenaria anguillulae PL171]|uniref:Uncharacterized protein n=1 Tax=Catenaria anguillulae PL171 TaxID=765915 RepID=A0A1Y2H9C8_9FUNG|nr:hypothetical protein BCR44DRAFT_28384 [Catenaria anguillulae PL171]
MNSTFPHAGLGASVEQQQQQRSLDGSSTQMIPTADHQAQHRPSMKDPEPNQDGDRESEADNSSANDSPGRYSDTVTRFTDLNPYLQRLPPEQAQFFNWRILQLMCCGKKETPELIKSVLDEIRAAIAAQPPSPPAPTTGWNRNRIIEVHGHLKIRMGQSGTHRLLVKASAHPPDSLLITPASAPAQPPSLMSLGQMPNPTVSHAVLMQWQSSPWPAAQDSMHPWLPRIFLSQVHDSISSKLGHSATQYDLTYTDRDADNDKIYIRTEDDWSEAMWAAIHYSPQKSAPTYPVIGAIGMGPNSTLGSTDAATAAQRLALFLFAGAPGVASGVAYSHNAGTVLEDTSKSVFVASFTLALTLCPKAISRKATELKCGECAQVLDPAHVKYQCTDCVGGFALCDLCFEQGAACIGHYLGEHVFVECSASRGGNQQQPANNGGGYISGMGFGEERHG